MINNKKINKKEAHIVFQKTWKMFNEVRKNSTDEGWEKCVNTAHKITEEYDDTFYKDIIVLIVGEADKECKLNNKERSIRYKSIAKSYNEMWQLIESFLDNQETFNINGVNMISEYNKKYDFEFAWKLSSIVYKYFSMYSTEEGSFMAISYDFYMKYKDGISVTESKDAFKMAESIIAIHPTYMLQMMNLYNDLKAVAA